MRIKDALDLLILSAMWGASFLFMSIAVPEFGPVVLAELRLAIASLVLLPVMLLRDGPEELKIHWKKLTTIGTVNSAVPFILLPFSTLYLTGGFASILNATAPLWTALIAWIWLSSILDVSRVAGLFLGFAGVIVLVWNKASFDLSGASLAIIAAIVASIFYGIGANATRKYLQGLRPLTIATGSQLGGALVLLPLAVLLWPADPVSIRAWAAIITMGVVSTGIAYIIYFRLIANIGPASAITVTYLVPGFAMFWGAMVLDEIVTTTMILGCAIIFAGTALATGLLPRNRA
jgi:drug/metabolite transporter (DMT)-like permease